MEFLRSQCNDPSLVGAQIEVEDACFALTIRSHGEGILRRPVGLNNVSQ